MLFSRLSSIPIRSDMLKSIAVIGSFLWITTIWFVYSQLASSNSTPQGSEQTMRNWRLTLDSLTELQNQNRELKKMLETERLERKAQHEKILAAKSDVPLNIEPPKQPEQPHVIEKIKIVEKLVPQNGNSYEIETSRRLLDDRIRELFYLIHRQTLSEGVKLKLESQMISLMGLSSKLENADNSEKSRATERKQIADRILSDIKRNQNPKSCKDSNVLICNLDKECGFGCQLHHVTYCAITAFATQRLLVLKKDGMNWKYSRDGWNSVFLPLSDTCKYAEAVRDETPAAFSATSTDRVVSLGIVDALPTRPAFLPQAVPTNLLRNISMVHSHPPAFFIGTVVAFLMRFNSETIDKLEKAAQQVEFSKGPIVGLQIRRTDKVGTEAAFHGLDEYMEWTEIWFKSQEKMENKVIDRRIFIASDDPTVVPEAKQKYPNYQVYGSTEIAETAQLSNRYTDASLLGVITDIYLLSKVDFLVCTFSSQVCRMGYELRQASGLDDGTKFHSLDDIYYFGGQQAHEMVAIESHKSASPLEIDLEIGDKIGIAGNHWDGYSKGTNRRTNKMGTFPSYKVVNDWRTYDFKLFV
ncbi:unnamed protein product [Caenorhabditis angaria]|uniref:Alpha-(1,6)-fucosyltransferase n=1 Tax=Caenorhabditis angaria TaxID=860376 RepID=A0A9P1IVY0_9PELO|nr:unnamed protein product [Caenorhabditis angaria]